VPLGPAETPADQNPTSLLASVLQQTEATIAGVGPEQAHLVTPCPDLDVTHLVDHMVGWASSFAARLHAQTFEGDPNSYRAGPHPAAAFHTAAESMLSAYRDDTEASGQMPPGFLMMEFLIHGWDLARATGQSTDFSPAAADEALAFAREMLAPEYRGPDKSFAFEVELGGAAGSVERLVAFSGRSPDWASPAATTKSAPSTATTTTRST
jgi:uncharacterized protein (TIGR03086 family)